MAKELRSEQSVVQAHQRARNEAISVIDTERQRLAYRYAESDSGPVRESLARRVSYLGGLIDRLIGWRHD